MTNTVAVEITTADVVAEAEAARDKMIAHEEGWGCDWYDYDAWRAYVDAIKTVKVHAAGPGRVVATIAGTRAGRIHGKSILGSVLDSQFDAVFETGLIDVDFGKRSALLTW